MEYNNLRRFNAFSHKMGKNSIKQGNALEIAIEMIEKTILNTNKNIKEGLFRIHPKKIIIVNGVRREIDLYVEVDVGIGQNLIYIFECKNWKKTFPPKEITEFSKKIEVTNAQKGYFVAKIFSKYVINEAKQYPRIELLRADDNFIDTAPFPSVDFLNIIHKKSQATITERIKPGDTRELRRLANFTAKEILHKGEKKEVKNFLDFYINEVTNEKINIEKVSSFPEGNYSFIVEKEIFFQEGEAIAEGRDMEKVYLNIEFDVLISKPKVVSRFDIEKRGRVITFEGSGPQGKAIQLSLIALNN